jgi:hypothetical protein
VASLHLLAHQLADFALLVAAEIELLEQVTGALALALAVAGIRHGKGKGGQGGDEQ